MKDLFARYENLLSLQKTKTLDDITEWGDKLIGNIHRFMLKQKSLLEQDYKNQTELLNKTCKQFMTELHVHEQINNTEQINQLLERCNALKFKLVAVEYIPQNLPFIHLTREDIKYEIPAEFDENEPENDKFHNTSTAKHDKKAKNYMNTNARSSAESRLTNIKQRKEQPLVIEISNDDDRSTDMVEECPTCFMAFPSNIALHDRTAHINGHLPND